MQADKFLTILSYAALFIMLITSAGCIAAAVAGVLAWGAVILMIFCMAISLMIVMQDHLF